MARHGIGVTLGHGLGGGKFSSRGKGQSVPDPTTVNTQATTALTDITAALAVSAISGDGDATTAVTLVQTDVTALQANVTLLTGNVSGADFSISWDDSVITNLNAFREALNEAVRIAKAGYGGLAE